MRVINACRTSLGLGLGLYCFVGVAACSDAVMASPGEFLAERPWPLHPELIISARAVRADAQADDGHYEGLYSLVLKVSGLPSGGSDSNLCVPGALMSDALALQRLSIDTAPLVLSGDVHAFGVRASFKNTSTPNPSSYESLRLFARLDKKLVQVFSETEFDAYSSEVSLSECGGTFEEKRSIIMLGQGESNGLKDLDVVSTFESGSFDSDCNKISESTRRERRWYRYDGEVYVAIGGT